MAKEQWYTIKVRMGFASIVARKLRMMHMDVRVPRQAIDPQEPHQRNLRSTRYLYCRLDLENRRSVITVPGVLDILSAADFSDSDNLDVI